MRVALVSDSHGDVRRLRRALDALVARGAEAVVHCGDVGSVECVAALGDAAPTALAVAGNMDRRVDQLAAAAERAGVTFSTRHVELDIGGGAETPSGLVATHGDDARLLAELIRGEQFAYVCHGHTHRRRDERFGAVRVINPGALRHPRGGSGPGAALLDTDAGAVNWVKP
ncbi:MAG: metallophosphoesterase family protein [Phycisphaerae bacterium]|nr:metallophosphoesterase family protein [Phycisphaerae bacterium]